jgi:hypothetical protein
MRSCNNPYTAREKIDEHNQEKLALGEDTPLALEASTSVLRADKKAGTAISKRGGQTVATDC